MRLYFLRTHFFCLVLAIKINIANIHYLLSRQQHATACILTNIQYRTNYKSKSKSKRDKQTICFIRSYISEPQFVRRDCRS